MILACETYISISEEDFYIIIIATATSVLPRIAWGLIWSYYLDNSAVASQGGAGIRAAQVIADHGVKALLTPRCGENAEEVLRKSEVLIYKSIPGTVQQNIDAFAAEQLILLSDFHPGFHGHEK